MHLSKNSFRSRKYLSKQVRRQRNTRVVRITIAFALGTALSLAASTTFAASSKSSEPKDKQQFYYEGNHYQKVDPFVKASQPSAPHGNMNMHGARGIASATPKMAMPKNLVRIDKTKYARENHGHKHMMVNKVHPDKAIAKLKTGNLRFVQSSKTKRKASKGDRLRLVAGQTPHTVVLSCSDSRVPPEIVFDQGLGDIFTVRSAGEALDSAIIASIEYAVDHLGVQLVLVLGHESCGAVTAALQTMPGESAGSPYLDLMVADIQPRLAGYFRRPASSGMLREVTANSRGVARDLIKRSEIIRARVGMGKLQVRSAVYHFDSGMVHFH